MFLSTFSWQAGEASGPPLAEAIIFGAIMAAGLIAAPNSVFAGIGGPSSAGPTRGVDDNNKSVLIPDPATPIGFGTTVAQCPWINTAMNAFDTANPTWTYSWSTSSLQSGISLDQYYAWVVNEPTLYAPAPDGNISTNTGDNYANTDVGGAAFSMQFTPSNGQAVGGIGFIQAYQEKLYNTASGNVTNIKLDNGGRTTPYYGSARTNRGTSNISWLLDVPSDVEPEAQEAFSSDVEFQTVVAIDTGAAGGFQHNLVLYNGYWWGYQYSTTEAPAPEPAPLTIMAIAAIGLLLLRREGRKDARST